MKLWTPSIVFCILLQNEVFTWTMNGYFPSIHVLVAEHVLCSGKRTSLPSRANFRRSIEIFGLSLRSFPNGFYSTW